MIPKVLTSWNATRTLGNILGVIVPARAAHARRNPIEIGMRLSAWSQYVWSGPAWAWVVMAYASTQV
jgi:hypothetical protein